VVGLFRISFLLTKLSKTAYGSGVGLPLATISRAVGALFRVSAVLCKALGSRNFPGSETIASGWPTRKPLCLQ